jgi:hypothetical protein
MTVWQKPCFEELTMNAEIGAYQSDYGDDERGDDPLLQLSPESPPERALPVHRG